MLLISGEIKLEIRPERTFSQSTRGKTRRARRRMPRADELAYGVRLTRRLDMYGKTTYIDKRNITANEATGTQPNRPH